MLKREMLQVDTRLGRAAVKACRLEDAVRYYPEYSSVTELSRTHNLPFREVYAVIQEECRKLKK